MPLTQVQNGMLAGVIPASLGGTGTTAGVTGFKNRIINGDMTIAQRSVGPVNNSSAGATLIYDTVDRFGYWAQFANIFSTQQSSIAPTGFKNSVLITSLANTSIASNSYYLYAQRIEGFNMSDLDWGTVNAKTVTFSFWVRSSLTGTFSGYVFNNGFTYNYPFTYTITTANTWEQKSITIAGPTAGTWLSNNGIGIEIGLTLGVGGNYQSTANTWTAGSFACGSPGSTNLVATSGATLYTTGWQLEVGSAATNFDYLPYGTELMLCQRYYFQTNGVVYAAAYGSSPSTNSIAQINTPSVMRTTPTVTLTNSSNGTSFGPGSTCPELIFFTAAPTGTGAPRANMQATAEL